MLTPKRKKEFELASGFSEKTTEPNQALQRMTTLVTDRAPSSTLRAKRVHR
jgi:hypothetical protein